MAVSGENFPRDYHGVSLLHGHDVAAGREADGGVDRHEHAGVATKRAGRIGNVSDLQLRWLLEGHEVHDPDLERSHAAARGAERSISRGHLTVQNVVVTGVLARGRQGSAVGQRRRAAGSFDGIRAPERSRMPASANRIHSILPLTPCRIQAMKEDDCTFGQCIDNFPSSSSL